MHACMFRFHNVVLTLLSLKLTYFLPSRFFRYADRNVETQTPSRYRTMERAGHSGRKDLSVPRYGGRKYHPLL